MTQEQAERKIRSIIREAVGCKVEAVQWVRAQVEGEFAALVTYGDPSDYVLAFLTDPKCPVEITRETDTRIFLRLAAGSQQ